MPLETLREEISEPFINKFPVDVLAVPTPKCVMVEVPPVHCGKEIFAALLIVEDVRLHPVASLGTATRE